MDRESFAKWAFLVGIVAALVIGLLAQPLGEYFVYFMLALFVLGLAVGFLNLSERNFLLFIVASIALLIIRLDAVGGLSILINTATLRTIQTSFSTFITGAVIVVSIKAILATSNTPSKKTIMKTIKKM